MKHQNKKNHENFLNSLQLHLTTLPVFVYNCHILIYLSLIYFGSQTFKIFNAFQNYIYTIKLESLLSHLKFSDCFKGAYCHLISRLGVNRKLAYLFDILTKQEIIRTAFLVYLGVDL